MHRHGDGNLSLKLRSASASIELRNLTDQLRKQIGKEDFGDQNKNVVFGPLNTFRLRWGFTRMALSEQRNA